MVACCLLVEADELGYGNEEKKKRLEVKRRPIIGTLCEMKEGNKGRLQ
jgi:hypothetical protein